MEAIFRKINRIFEAIGSPIRATIDGGDIFVRDLVIISDEEGSVEVIEVSAPESSLFSGLRAEDATGVASIVALHIMKKIISNAAES